MPPFNPDTHREDYTKVENELSAAKKEISGEKSIEELQVLATKRDELKKELERQLGNAQEAANEDNKILDTAEENKIKTQKEIDDLKAHIESLDIEIEKIKGMESDLEIRGDSTLEACSINPATVFAKSETQANRKGLSFNSNFDSLIQPLISNSVVESEKANITTYRINRDMTAQEIFNELKRQGQGNDVHFTIEQLASLINNQNELNEFGLPISENAILSESSGNFFLTKDKEGKSVALVISSNFNSGKPFWVIEVEELSSNKMFDGSHFDVFVPHK